MLNFNTSKNRESFPQFDSEQLANIINHDIKNIPLDNMGMATHNYDVMFIENVMNAIELQADIDRFAGILKTCWKIDVARYRQEVVWLNTKTHLYEPYYPHFEEKVDAIVEKIRQTRELELSLQRQKEEWERSQHGALSHTKIPIASSETNQTTQPTFDANETVEYHLEDLPKDVKPQILITDDKVFSDFVTTMCGPVKGWIDKRRLQDWNVVRFVCRLRGIVARKCSMPIFGKLLDGLGLGNQENNMKHRQDANDKDALVAYDEVTAFNRQKYYYLRKDGKEIEELLSDVIKAVAA